MSEIIEVNSAEMLTAINRSEVDMQIATAKQYPRDLMQVMNKISTLATLDQETAESCFYVLKRENQRGESSVIEGLSVRMAEIIASAWGNLRVQTRIIGNDGKMITAQAVCHDLESNLAICKEVKRRITTKSGKTFSEDMQVVTGNAASSIAFRNAVLTVIPKAITKKIIEEVKQVALGKALDMDTSRQKCVETFAKVGVNTEMLCDYLGISNIDEVDKEGILTLRATWTAIKEGDTTVQETFIKPQQEKKAAALAEKKAGSVADMVAQAMDKSVNV